MEKTLLVKESSTHHLIRNQVCGAMTFLDNEFPLQRVCSFVKVIRLWCMIFSSIRSDLLSSVCLP